MREQLGAVDRTPVWCRRTTQRLVLILGTLQADVAARKFLPCAPVAGTPSAWREESTRGDPGAPTRVIHKRPGCPGRLSHCPRHWAGQNNAYRSMSCLRYPHGVPDVPAFFVQMERCGVSRAPQSSSRAGDFLAEQQRVDVIEVGENAIRRRDKRDSRDSRINAGFQEDSRAGQIRDRRDKY